MAFFKYYLFSEAEKQKLAIEQEKLAQQKKEGKL
jgi:hypothetical protein